MTSFISPTGRSTGFGLKVVKLAELLKRSDDRIEEMGLRLSSLANKISRTVNLLDNLPKGETDVKSSNSNLAKKQQMATESFEMRKPPLNRKRRVKSKTTLTATPAVEKEAYSGNRKSQRSRKETTLGWSNE